MQYSSFKQVQVREQGFTLVELLIVVIIIGILASIGVPQYMKTIEKARGGEAWAGIQQVQSGEKIYYAENGFYLSTAAPMTDTEEGVLDISLPQSKWGFKVTTTDKYANYTITATRGDGRAKDTTITMDQAGTKTNAWETAVNLW